MPYTDYLSTNKVAYITPFLNFYACTLEINCESTLCAEGVVILETSKQ